MSFSVSVLGGESELLYGNYLYISYIWSDNECSISRINVNDATVTPWLVDNTNGFAGMDIYDNYMYVVNNFTGTISKITLDEIPTVELWLSGLNKPFDIKAHNGYLYVLQKNYIKKINMQTKLVTRQWSTAQTYKTYYMYIRNNYLYIPGGIPGKIYKLNLLYPTNNLEILLDNLGSINPKSLFIVNHTVFMTDETSYNIYKVDLNSKSIIYWDNLTGGQLVCDNNYVYILGTDPFNYATTVTRVDKPTVASTIDCFFVNEPFTISQTANIFSNNLPLPYTEEYDYILDVNINGIWNSMNDLFIERRFMTEDEAGLNGSNYDFIHLNVDRNTLANLLTTADVVSISSEKQSVYLDHAGVYNTLDMRNSQLVGFRFLEIVATKIFGHAKTKIAIENSDEYYTNDYNDDYNIVNSLIGQIAWGIFNSVINKKVDIMNDYIKTDRIQDNADGAVLTNINGYPRPFMDFNFNDTVWEFPIIFHTKLLSTSGDSIVELNNGPDVGGAQLVNGIMDVPVLIRFSA